MSDFPATLKTRERVCPVGTREPTAPLPDSVPYIRPSNGSPIIARHRPRNALDAELCLRGAAVRKRSGRSQLKGAFNVALVDSNDIRCCEFPRRDHAATT